MQTICPICGKNFNALRAQKYCDTDCREKAKKMRNAPKPKICLGCGIEFMPTGQNAKYHSTECRKKSNYTEHNYNNRRRKILSEIK